MISICCEQAQKIVTVGLSSLKLNCACALAAMFSRMSLVVKSMLQIATAANQYCVQLLLTVKCVHWNLAFVYAAPNIGQNKFADE